MTRMTGKTILITGVASGIGLATARRVLDEGGRVVGIDRDGEGLGRAVGTLGSPPADRLVTAVADVMAQEQVDRAVRAGVSSLGPLDGVAANAGVVSAAPWDAVSDEDWELGLGVNLRGAFHTVKAGVEHLRSREVPGGSIVITSSVAGLKGFRHRSVYTASKHAVTGLARSLAQELGPRGIRVNTVHPTRVDTPMLAGLKALADPNNRPAELPHLLPVESVAPEDVANAILFLLTDESRYITGVALPVDAGALQK